MITTTRSGSTARGAALVAAALALAALAAVAQGPGSGPGAAKGSGKKQGPGAGRTDAPGGPKQGPPPGSGAAPDPAAPPAPAGPTPEEIQAQDQALDTLRRMDEAARLVEVEGLVSQNLMEFDPAAHYRAGAFPAREPPRVDLLDIQGDWSTALHAIQAAATAIDAEALTPERRLDLEWLRAWARAEMLLAEGWTTARWNPRPWLERARDLVEGPLRDESGARAIRAAALAGALESLPATADAARHALRLPAGELVLASLPLADELCWTLEGEVHALGLDLVAPGAHSQAFEAARVAAADAVRGLRDWLGAQTAAQGIRPERLAPKAFAELLAAVAGTELGIEELRASVLLELSELERRLGPSAGLPAAPPQLPEAADVASSLDAASREARALAERAGFALPAAPPPSFACRNARFHASAWTRWSAAPGAAPTAWVDLPSRAFEGAALESRAKLLGPDALRALAVQIGAAGEGLGRALVLAGDSAARRWAPNEVALQGLGLYATDWILRLPPEELGAFAGEHVRAELLRRRKLAAARLLLAIEIHGRRTPSADASLAFAAYTGLDPAIARDEAAAVIGNPLSALGYLGYMELLRLERQLGPPGEPTAAARRTVTLVLRNPGARAVDWAALSASGELAHGAEGTADAGEQPRGANPRAPAPRSGPTSDPATPRKDRERPPREDAESRS
jgi:hypothetical protein